MKETVYGVISDVHDHPENVGFAISTLSALGAEKLIVNGDIGTGLEGMTGVLESIGKSGLESYVQPGSHETLKNYSQAISAAASKHSNVIDAVSNRKIGCGDHSLVFLPGSDFTCGGEFSIGNGKIKSGDYYQNVHNELLPANTPREELQRLSDMGKLAGFISYSNMNDLRRDVTSPENTIVVCHVPMRFGSVSMSPDMAEFGLVTQDFGILDVETVKGERGRMIYLANEDKKEIEGRLRSANVKKILNENNVPEGSVIPLQNVDFYSQFGAPVEVRKENRGNEALRKVYDELGVEKSITGHFHESVGRAEGKNGNVIPPNYFNRNLFWNASYLDGMKAGVLRVRGNCVSYQNVDLNQYASKEDLGKFKFKGKV